MRHSNVVLEIVRQLAGRGQIIAGKALFDARNVLADIGVAVAAIGEYQVSTERLKPPFAGFTC